MEYRKRNTPLLSASLDGLFFVTAFIAQSTKRRLRRLGGHIARSMAQAWPVYVSIFVHGLIGIGVATALRAAPRAHPPLRDVSIIFLGSDIELPRLSVRSYQNEPSPSEASLEGASIANAEPNPSDSTPQPSASEALLQVTEPEPSGAAVARPISDGQEQFVGPQIDDAARAEAAAQVLRTIRCHRLGARPLDECDDIEPSMTFDRGREGPPSITPQNWLSFERPDLQDARTLQILREEGCVNRADAAPVTSTQEYFLDGAGAAVGRVPIRREGPFCD